MWTCLHATVPICVEAPRLCRPPSRCPTEVAMWSCLQIDSSFVVPLCWTILLWKWRSYVGDCLHCKVHIDNHHWQPVPLGGPWSVAFDNWCSLGSLMVSIKSRGHIWEYDYQTANRTQDKYKYPKVTVEIKHFALGWSNEHVSHDLAVCLWWYLPRRHWGGHTGNLAIRGRQEKMANCESTF
jgi:hypothetical protein